MIFNKFFAGHIKTFFDGREKFHVRNPRLANALQLVILNVVSGLTKVAALVIYCNLKSLKDTMLSTSG